MNQVWMCDHLILDEPFENMVGKIVDLSVIQYQTSCALLALILKLKHGFAHPKYLHNSQ
jgi:hypothetical protein